MVLLRTVDEVALPECGEIHILSFAGQEVLQRRGIGAKSSVGVYSLSA